MSMENAVLNALIELHDDMKLGQDTNREPVRLSILAATGALARVDRLVDAAFYLGVERGEHGNSVRRNQAIQAVAACIRDNGGRP